MKAADALDKVLKGEAGEASQPVRELAQLAALLQGAWQEGPDPASTGRVRTAALAAFQEAPVTSIAPTNGRTRSSGGKRLVMRMALAAALVAGLPTAAWAASEESLPGQVLYPLKRGFEELRLVLAGDAASEADVLLGMAEERLEEAVLALALDLGAVVDQALAGYDEALLRFRVRVVQAQAEGLHVEALLEEAQDLAIVQEELFEEDVPAVVPPAGPTPAQANPGETGKGDNGKGKAQGKAGGGKGKAKGHRGSGGNPGGSGGAGGDSSRGSGGGNTPGGGHTGGGGNGGGGLGDGRQEEPPVLEEDPDAADDDEGTGSGSSDGEGLGHEKARGKGHQKHGDKG